MTKRPQSETKGVRKATSNKQKRAVLKAKRQEQKQKEAKRERETRLTDAVRAGGVLADASRQVRTQSLTTRLVYMDQPFDCVDCGKHEVWTAAQQKWYYEVAKGPLEGKAIRCRACRQKLRRQRDSQRKTSTR